MGILDNNYIMDMRPVKVTGNIKDVIKRTGITVDDVIDYAKENGFLQAKKVSISFRCNFREVKTESNFEINITTGINIDKYKGGYLLQINKGIEDGKKIRPINNFNFYISNDDIISVSLHGVTDPKSGEFNYLNVLELSQKGISIWF